jgi:hypothetical protein
MNPIPTTNAMKPAAGKGVPSFPTPVIKDTVIVEVVNAWKGDYIPLEYGAKWDDHPHASQQGSFPDHKLINQAPTSEDGQWVKRIWANDRVDQDTYNYAIKYSGGSDAHPIYIRTYLEPRETYAPVLDGTTDPLFPGAFLVDEEVTRTEGEFDSRYVQVTRVYETLPGPVIPTKRINERGDLETVNTQVVPPNTAPDPDGLFVTQTQVAQDEVSKGVKTTATVPSHSQLLIKEKKEGLLGETITTDDIVLPSTTPDDLSQSVVASTVQQTSATKAVKRTTTASGPTSLTQKSKDGKLIGDVTITESVVAPNSNPDAVSTSVLASEVKQVDSGKAIKRNTVLNSTPTLLGSDSKGGLLGQTTVSETVVNSGTTADAPTLSIVSSSVEPIDSVRSRKTTITSTGPTTLTGKEKKEGLLGETTITESIVAAGENPDALSQIILSSSVEPIDSAKSKKTTIVSTGPTSLTQRSKDGKLLGDIVITESIVAPTASPDSPSGVNTGIISSEIKQLDGGKALKRNTSLNSTPTLLGSETKPGLLGTTITEETVVPSGTGAAALTLNIVSSSVDAIDASRSRRIIQTSNGPTSLIGRQKRDGLLGETTTTESIVASNAQPDNLSASIVSSEISPIDSAKSKKTTTVSSGPTSLVGRTRKQGLLGETVVTESIVAANATADPLSLTVISSQVEPIDSAKSKKTTEESTGPTSLAGRTINSFGVSETITESIVVPAQSVDLTGLVVADQISPIDSEKSKRERRVLVNMPDNYDYYETVSNEKVVIKNTVQILRRNDPLNPIPIPVVDSTTLDVQDTPLEFPWIRRVTKSIPTNLPPSRIEWDVITYTFPGIIYSWKARLQNEEVKANLAFFDNRYPVSMTVASRNEISYHAENDPALDLSSLEFFRVITRPWARIYFNIPDNTIHPPAPITITGQSVERGGIAFDISGGQGSEPSFYTPGDEILIGAETKLWWGGIYIKKLVYVKEPI